MTRNLREYHRPAEAAEAAALLGRGDTRTVPLVVGPRVPDERLAGSEAVVDLGRLGLDAISVEGGVVRLGAHVSLQALADSPPLQRLGSGIVAEAALLSAGSAMRRAATVGGALLYARMAASGTEREGPPELLLALLVLDAGVVIQGEQTAEVDLPGYLAGTAAEGLIVEVRCPLLRRGARTALARVARTPRDQAIVAAAAWVHGGNVRLAVAPGGYPPHRLTNVEQSLAGRQLTDDAVASVGAAVEAAVSPQSDFRASAEYRRAMAGVLARRALSIAAQRAAQ